MSREQDAKIAEWMGWTNQDMPPEGQFCLAGGQDWWIPPNSKDGYGYCGRCESVPPPYSSDLNAMAEAERVVAERGLHHEYIGELNIVTIKAGCDRDISQGWHLATARRLGAHTSRWDIYLPAER